MLAYKSSHVFKLNISNLCFSRKHGFSMLNAVWECFAPTLLHSAKSYNGVVRNISHQTFTFENTTTSFIKLHMFNIFIFLLFYYFKIHSQPHVTKNKKKLKQKTNRKNMFKTRMRHEQFKKHKPKCKNQNVFFRPKTFWSTWPHGILTETKSSHLFKSNTSNLLISRNHYCYTFNDLTACLTSVPILCVFSTRTCKTIEFSAVWIRFWRFSNLLVGAANIPKQIFICDCLNSH